MEEILLDALRSIADHAKEFDGIEDYETMVVRMTSKANEALREAQKYQIS
jgi:hypothetical protein